MKRFLSLMLALVLSLSLFTACGSDPASTTPDSSAEPTPTPRLYFPNPFTGEEKTSDFKEGQRAVAIMVNNISVCRPQRGLSDASILFESKVEGGITRFMAVFEDYTTLPDVGPVRSGRDQFLRWAMPWQMLYCHIGRSGITQTYIDTMEYNDYDLDGNHKNFVYRDQNRLAQGYASEHTAYTNAEELMKAIDKYDYDMNKTYSEPLFDFVDYDMEGGGWRELNGESAEEITVVHSEVYRTYFDYDAASKKYMMSQYNGSKKAVEETIDENNGEQLGFENVFIAFADISTYPYPGGNLDKNGNDKGDPNYQKVDMSYGGIGYYFSNGKVEQIRWFKGGTMDRLRFTDMDENNLEINIGKSYIGFVDLDEYERFGYAGNGEEVTEDVIDSNVTENEAETDF
ncbi:MAG: DUF3048 domain-containing protein [Oscillospiraceae bacterium]|nr:DUF3048 domain-containing protein [Oscillospiraceae bacterium]